MPLTIIKIGGSVINKESKKPKINAGNINKLGNLLKGFKEPYCLGARRGIFRPSVGEANRH